MIEEKVSFYEYTLEKMLNELGKEKLIDALKKMVMIRQFETRAEGAYTAGKIGGFFHSYIGEEAIQTAAIMAAGTQHWFTTSYRCHALALLLGEKPLSLMAELFGRKTGNAKGRGGSMHFSSSHMLGGFGIVGGQISIATGAAFSCKYQNQNDRVSFCFLGDGSCAQGSFHESLNLAGIQKVPCLYVVENNQWSMGTPLVRTLANPESFTYYAAKAYGMPHMKLDGMDFLACYNGFKEALNIVLTKQTPILIECTTERFRGHSISDPGLYRSKDDLKEIMKKDPLLLLKQKLVTAGFLTEDEYKAIETSERQRMSKVVEDADMEPWPTISELEKDVFSDSIVEEVCK